MFRRTSQAPAPDAPAISTAQVAPIEPPLPLGAVEGPVRRVLPRPQPRARERSALGWITLGAVLLSVGVAALLDGAGALLLSPVQYLALILAILGLGLLVGTWSGRARWLIVPGVLIVPLVLAASLIHVPVAGGFGDRQVRPADASALRPAYRLVAGQLVLDLRDLQLASQTVSIRATIVAGRILVLLPQSSAVHVHARSGAGEVALFGQTNDGVKVDVERVFQSAAAGGQVNLDLETSFGQVEVRR